MGDRVALVVDPDADAPRGRALQGRPGLLGAERLVEESGNVRVQAPDAGKNDDREEHGRRRRNRGG